MKKQDIVNLIKYHLDKDDVSFFATATSIARSFAEEGDEQIAKYIVGLLSGPLSYSPQDISGNYGFFKLVDKATDVLLLPTVLKREIGGLITACRSKLGINKIIFEGKPGTGKTQTALIVAKTLNRQLLMVNANNVIDSKLGQSAKNLADMFEFINRISKKGNYVFLIDEIDSLVMDRVNQQDLREMGRLTSSFLKELDNLDTNAIVIATTNLYDKLDRALKRRFDVEISFDKYTKEDLADLAVIFAQDYYSNDVFEKSDCHLLKKMFINSNVELNPAEIKNLIRLSVAFTGNNKTEFFKRVFYVLGYNSDDSEIVKLQNAGFTTRELEILLSKSKSSISRHSRGVKHGV